MTTEERLFIDNADNCLVLIEKAAHEIGIKGVAVAAYIPGNKSESWISKMKVVGALNNGEANYLAIAYSKAGEMADTLNNSGNRTGDPMFGEFGYKGGLIIKINSGYILTVFSGGTGEQDLAVAKIGLDWIVKSFN